jgi:hypothetical protein
VLGSARATNEELSGPKVHALFSRRTLIAARVCLRPLPL